MDIIVDDIVLHPDEREETLGAVIADRLGMQRPPAWRILRKSLDSRKKRSIHYRYRLAVNVPDTDAPGLLGLPGVAPCLEGPAPAAARCPAGGSVAVIGSGPAGLFAALRLIDAGVRVTIFERGRTVDDRMKDIVSLESEGALNRESNVLFGEGGAGAYSDGKLTTRTSRPESAWFFRRMVDMGAPGSILYDAKPHVGTDMLSRILVAIRTYIASRGSSILFNHRVDDLMMSGNSVRGLVTSDGFEHAFDRIVLATGHSARDTYEMLDRCGVALAAKAFTAGVRVEHPRELIDTIQYGKPGFSRPLPAADYRLAFRDPVTGRGVYSFCMCPGGKIINSSSEPVRLCTNGMSYSARDLGFSNAALVVTVGVDDFGCAPLSGIALQRSIEEKAFISGGGGFRAPAQRVSSFIRGKSDAGLPQCSFRPGVSPARMDEFLPEWITGPLRAALPEFNRRMRGFITAEGILLGAETRTSSPVRVMRGDDFQSLSHRGLYPVGEGAGYAGGIVSSAVDGIRAADIIIAELCV